MDELGFAGSSRTLGRRRNFPICAALVDALRRVDLLHQPRYKAEETAKLVE